MLSTVSTPIRSLMLVLLASTAALATGAASAQTQQASAPDAVKAEDPTVLKTVTVTATRTATPLAEAPATVSVITREDMDRRLVQTPSDLVRYEPGVSLGNNPDRSGATSYTIRGVGGNRVLVLTDGARLPDFPSSSSQTYNRDYVDLETVKRVEIVRGPSSSLYGSDAIGGVVAYTTKDPSDYLTAGKDQAVTLKGSYDSGSATFTESATGAMRVGNASALVSLTRRDGEETTPAEYSTPNPQDYSANTGLAKLVLDATDVDTLKFTVEAREATTKTDILTERSATVLDSDADESNRRLRFGFEHEHDAPIGFVDRLKWSVSAQDLQREEDLLQNRLSGGSTIIRSTDQDFDQRIYQGEVQLETAFDLSWSKNLLVYGLDADWTESARPRDRTDCNQTTNVCTKTISGETYPSKNFPDTDTLLAGAYVQDQLSINGTRLKIVPGVRVDYYRLSPQIDQAFLNNSTTTTPEKFDEVALSPKLGATLGLNDELSLYGGYAHGFRAPPYDNANFGFTNATFGYQIVPNSSLKPETSDSVELGIRGEYASGSRFSLSAYHNWYKDFIDTVTIASAPLLTFQYQNLEEVRIYGIEGTGEYALNEAVSLLGGFSWAQGHDDQSDQALASVDPMKIVAGVRYTAPEDYGVEFTGTYRDKDDEVSSATSFQAPSSTVFDVTGYWQPTEAFTVNAGVFNIFDKEYYDSQDVSGVSATAANLGRYARAGRTFGVSATVRW
jgi:hemoglobin/transferrin/lactoferrin receptor protein